MIATSHRSCKQNFLSKGLHSTSFPTAKVFMDAGDILPAGDYLETNLHPIWVWGARGVGARGVGARGVGARGVRARGLEIFLVVSIYKTRLTCWCLAERALFGRSRSGALGLGRRIIFPLFYLVGITPVM